MRYLLASFLLCFSIIAGYGQKWKNSSIDVDATLGFTENRGQLADEKSQKLNAVLYYGSGKGVDFYIEKNKIKFVFVKLKPAEKKDSPGILQPDRKIPYEASRMELEFVGANPVVSVIPTEENQGYTNYYLPQCPDGITKVKSYKKLVFKEIYPSIDLVVESIDTALKYSFVIRPGADPSDIQLQWNGAQKIRDEKSGGITYASALAEVRESAPLSFQGAEKVDSRFLRKGSRISFEIRNYDQARELLIDPVLSWGTYYGGLFGSAKSSLDYLKDIAVDGKGNVYGFGHTISTVGIATAGAFQTAQGGTSFTYDAFIVKISSSGKRVWGTYLGGSSSDYGGGGTVDSFGHIYFAGQTFSSNVIATSGTHQSAYKGLLDAFVEKLDTSGMRIWGTYYGGTNRDAAVATVCDRQGNVYIGGITGSTSLIASSGGFSTSAGGSLDAFAAKLDSSGSRLWGTYLGGSGSDYCQDIAMDTADNLYLTGYTASTTGIASAGAFQASKSGVSDAFLEKFSSSGTRLWGTYFGGTGDELGNGVDCDPAGKIFITGTTTSSSGIATAGAAQEVFGTEDDIFIAAFSSSGSRRWSTYYGGYYADQGMDIAAADSNYIFVTGSAKSRGLAFGGNATGDALLIQMDTAGKLYWAGYTGGPDTYPESIVAQSANTVYTGGSTNSSTGIATSGTHQATRIGEVDGYLQRFDKFYCPVRASVTGTSSLCLNSTATYKVNKQANTRYRWYVAGGSILSGQGSDSIVVNWTRPETTTVTVSALDTVTTCYDSVIRKIKIIAPVITMKRDFRICGGDSAVIGSIKGQKLAYSWTSVPSGFTSSASNFKVSPSKTTKYKLTVLDSSTGCYNYDSVTVHIDSALLKEAAPDTVSICEKDSAMLIAKTREYNGYALHFDGIDDYAIVNKTCTGCSWSPYELYTDWLIEVWVNTNATSGTQYILSKGSNNSYYGHYGLRLVDGYPEFNYNMQFGTSGAKSSVPLVKNKWYHIAISNAKDSVRIYINGKQTGAGNAGTVLYTTMKLQLGHLDTFRSESYFSGMIDELRIWTLNISKPTLAELRARILNNMYRYQPDGIRLAGLFHFDENEGNITYDATYHKIAFDLYNGVRWAASPIPLKMNVIWSPAVKPVNSLLDSVWVKPPASTTYYAQITNPAAGCVFKDSVRVIVHPLPKPSIIETAKACSGKETVYYTAKNAGNTYSWKVTGGTIAGESKKDSVIIEWGGTGNGTLEVKEVTNLGCSDSVKLGITIHPLPEASAGPDQTICKKITAQIGSTPIAGHKYNWVSLPVGFSSSFSSQVVSPDSTTKYYLEVTDTATGCTNSDEVVIKVDPLPTVSLAGEDTLCQNETAWFRAAKHTGSNYTWKVVNGSLSSPAGADSLKITWTNAGAGSVKVIERIRATGCMDSATIQVIIYPNPIAGFSVSTVCRGSETQFNDTSSAHQKRLWYFGDGDTTTLSSPSHTYKLAGTYTASLVIWTANGCKDSAARKVTVKAKPKAGFGWTNACFGNSVSFYDSSQSAGVFEWNFGDGSSSVSRFPKHVYSAPGKYWVVQKVETNQGCLDSAGHWIEVYPPPVVRFTVDSVCLGDPIIIQDSSSGLHTWNWNFGDGAYSQLQKPEHTFKDAGKYEVKLKGTSVNGCSDSAVVWVQIHALPVVRFTVNKVCLGDPLVIHDSSSELQQWNWNFGDGTNSQLQKPDHTFMDSGKYEIKLKGISASGCSDSAVVWVQVYAPDAKWSVTGKDLDFTFRANDTTYTSNAYQWNFGDGKTGMGSIVSHKYIGKGFYNVRLIVSSVDCSESFDSTIEAKENVGMGENYGNGFELTLSPNPFTSRLKIEYTLENTSTVGIQIYDMLGREIVAWEPVQKQSGSHSLTWAPAQKKQSGGTYLVKLVVNNKIIIRKVIRI